MQFWWNLYEFFKYEHTKRYEYEMLQMFYFLPTNTSWLFVLRIDRYRSLYFLKVWRNECKRRHFYFFNINFSMSESNLGALFNLQESTFKDTENKILMIQNDFPVIKLVNIELEILCKILWKNHFKGHDKGYPNRDTILFLKVIFWR